MWEQFYQWNSRGISPDIDWDAWDADNLGTLIKSFPEDWWRSARPYYSPDFASHVDAAYSGT